MTPEPILVVDDNPTNLKLARILLESAGAFSISTTRTSTPWSGPFPDGPWGAAPVPRN